MSTGSADWIVIGSSSGSSGSSSGGIAPDTDYAPIPATDADPDGGETADQVRQQDLATLFPSGSSTVRITRLSGDLSQQALATDLILQAASDQSEVSNVHPIQSALPVGRADVGGYVNCRRATGGGLTVQEH